MILFWRIRYLDRTDRKFKDRDLYIDTGKLDATMKASVELCYELNESGTSREILKYRHLFREDSMAVEDKVALCGDQGFGSVYFLQDYFEDECGKELSDDEIAQIMTGSPTARAIPHWADQHDVELMTAPPAPIEIDKIAASDQDLKVLGYFVRDLRELENSAFRKEGPGRLTCSKGVAPALQTAVSDDEIRSHITIFRRLYMSSEPANFLVVVALFRQLTGDYPLVKWVGGIAQRYVSDSENKPDFVPLDGRDKWTFTQKRLIDVFIYTQYAHQPSEQRIRQFQECLKSVDNQGQTLTWLFLSSLWHASIQMINAGRVIARVYDAYCDQWGQRPALLDSISADTPGLGQLETKENRKKRVFEAKAAQLAGQLWEEKGRPEGGVAFFLEQARAQLRDSVSGADQSK